MVSRCLQLKEVSSHAEAKTRGGRMEGSAGGGRAGVRGGVGQPASLEAHLSA
jgi:hypothetical protein